MTSFKCISMLKMWTSAMMDLLTAMLMPRAPTLKGLSPVPATLGTTGMELPVQVHVNLIKIRSFSAC